MVTKYYQFKLNYGRGAELQVPLQCGIAILQAGQVYETPYRPDITRLTGKEALKGEYSWVGVVYRDENGALCDEDGNLVR